MTYERELDELLDIIYADFYVVWATHTLEDEMLSSINDVRTTDRGTIYIYGKNGPLAAFHKDLLALAGGAR